MVKTFNNVWLILSAYMCLEMVFCQYGFQNPYQEIPFASSSFNSYPSHFLSYDYYGTPTYTGYIPRVAMENDFNRIGDSVPPGFDQTGMKFADETESPFTGFSPDAPEQFPFHGFKNDNSEMQNVGLDSADNPDLLSNPNRFHQQHMPLLTTYEMPMYPKYFSPHGLTPDPPFTGIIPTSPDIPKRHHTRKDIAARRQSKTDFIKSFHKPFEPSKNPFLTDFNKNYPDGVTKNQNVPNQIYVPLFQTNLHRYDWNKLLNKFGQPINASADDRSLDNISQNTEQPIKLLSEHHEENTIKPTVLTSESPTEESSKLANEQQRSSTVPNNKEYFSNYPKEENPHTKIDESKTVPSEQSLYPLHEDKSSIKTTEKIWTKKQEQETKEKLNTEEPYKLTKSLVGKPTTSAGKKKSHSKPKKEVKELKPTTKPLAPTTPTILMTTQLSDAKSQEGQNQYSNNTTKAEWDDGSTKVFPDNMEDDDDEFSRKYIAPIPSKIPTMNELNAKNQTNKNGHSNDFAKALRAEESIIIFPNYKHINDENKNIPTEPQLSIIPTKVEATTTDSMENYNDEISRKYIAPIPSKIPTMNELIKTKNKKGNSNDFAKAPRADESTNVFLNNMKYIDDENINIPTEPQISLKPPKVETTTTYYVFKTNKKRHYPTSTSPYGNQNTIDSFNQKEDTHIGSPYMHQNSLKDQKYNEFKSKENVVDVDDSVDDVNSGMLNSGPEDDHIESDAEARDCIGTEKRETKIEVTFNRPETGTSPKTPYLVKKKTKSLNKLRNTIAVTRKAASAPKTTEIIVESRLPVTVDDSCQTTDGGRGTCMILYSCKPLLEKVARASEADVSLLRKAHCGFDGTIPKVCCPNASETTTASTLRPSPVTKRSLPKDMNLVDLFPKAPECGVGGDLQGPAGRIVGGLPAKLGSFPWMALLGYRTRTKSPDWKCGGSLITNSHVLTAAHCILNQANNLYIVRLGELDTARDDDGATPVDVPITKMIMHQKYDYKTLTNDIGIVFMESKVQFTPLIKPICLPLDKDLRKKTFEKYMPVVAGWGNTGFLMPESSYLRAVQLPVVTNKFCEEVYSRTRHRTNVIDERVLCAGFSKGKDSCQGDSGGPLMQPIWNSTNLVSYFYQIGIVSYGKKCGVGGVPGVYTRVTSFVPWIQQTVAGTMGL